MTDATGATAEVELVTAGTRDRMWGLVTDVPRIGEWSPECAGAAWLDDEGLAEDRPDGRVPQPGDRFEGRNEFAGGFASTVTCVVTATDRPAVFEWIVLDPSADPGRPGSVWRYELIQGPATGQTTVRHRFTHGSGRTGLSEAMREHPDEAEAILAERLDTLRKHMTITLERMAAS